MTRPFARRLACMTLRSTHSGKRHRSHGAACSQRQCRLHLLTLFSSSRPQSSLAHTLVGLATSLFARRSFPYSSVLTLSHVFTLSTHASAQPTLEHNSSTAAYTRHHVRQSCAHVQVPMYLDPSDQSTCPNFSSLRVAIELSSPLIPRDSSHGCTLFVLSACFVMRVGAVTFQVP